MTKKIIVPLLCLLALSSYGNSKKESFPLTVSLTKEVLMDKIKGGWAAQTIGVVYGAPTEFKFTGTTIQNYQPIPWSDGYVKYWWDKKPGLFDDIYNDLTFVETFEMEGLNCSIDTLARRFAWAEYHLAHANQAGRYNIRNGIMPPESGHWLNNPHADDIDFQIEADFIGLMAPGMVNQAMDIANRVGHIMNSGDGFYGGAFVSALYSNAFISSDVEVVLKNSLSAIPAESQFHQCIADVINLHKIYPDDWEQCWFELHKKWNKDVGCPKGVFLSFNIDAKINSAYIALALLYGKGDFSKSMEIAVRCGQDSDCNPASVGGILGVMCGYSKIPEFWLNPLKEIEQLNFEGTTISLSRAYNLSFKHALTLIEKNGGEISEKNVIIKTQKTEILPLEQNFKKTIPIFRERKDCFFTDEYTFDFNGNGFVVYGNLVSTKSVTADYIHRVSIRHIGSEVFGLAETNDNYVAEMEIWIDGELDRTIKLPMKNTSRRLEPAWKYLLAEGKHQVKLKWLNRAKDYLIRVNDIIYYSENKLPSNYYHN
ncbi:MAG: ADP-ribosylglycohydrolase family protein [Paludibacter sp.]